MRSLSILVFMRLARNKVFRSALASTILGVMAFPLTCHIFACTGMNGCAAAHRHSCHSEAAYEAGQPSAAPTLNCCKTIHPVLSGLSQVSQLQQLKLLSFAARLPAGGADSLAAAARISWLSHHRSPGYDGQAVLLAKQSFLI